jgi:hypothetical protein
MANHKEYKKFATGSQNTERISIPDIPNYESCKPAWSFRNLKYLGKVCLSQCNVREKSDFAMALLEISQFPWSEIHSKPKEHLGYEKIPVKRFKVALPPTVTQEAKLLVFRFSQTGRIAGYKTLDIFHIVAIGAKHQLY